MLLLAVPRVAFNVERAILAALRYERSAIVELGKPASIFQGMTMHIVGAPPKGHSHPTESYRFAIAHWVVVLRPQSLHSSGNGGRSISVSIS